MNIALVIAGGSGHRMGQNMPKQFITVEGKPILIHTMLKFQTHPDISAIAVVCLNGWESIVRSYAGKYRIDKLRWIFPGGDTGMESIHNGIYGLREVGCNDDDIVLIHDAVRPLVNHDIISNNIAICRTYGYAITGIRCLEAVLLSHDGFTAKESIPRDSLIRTQTPQTFRLARIIDVHERAARKGITNSVSSCTLLAELNEDIEMHIVPGSVKNLKITTQEDLDIMRLHMRMTHHD